MKKNGFTLAEVLITLAVIGIVAALTIGVFLPKIHSTIRSHQIAVAQTKCLEIPSGSLLVASLLNP